MAEVIAAGAAAKVVLPLLGTVVSNYRQVADTWHLFFEFQTELSNLHISYRGAKTSFEYYSVKCLRRTMGADAIENMCADLNSDMWNHARLSARIHKSLGNDGQAISHLLASMSQKLFALQTALEKFRAPVDEPVKWSLSDGLRMTAKKADLDTLTEDLSRLQSQLRITCNRALGRERSLEERFPASLPWRIATLCNGTVRLQHCFASSWSCAMPSHIAHNASLVATLGSFEYHNVVLRVERKEDTGEDETLSMLLRFEEANERDVVPPTSHSQLSAGCKSSITSEVLLAAVDSGLGKDKAAQRRLTKRLLKGIKRMFMRDDKHLAQQVHKDEFAHHPSGCLEDGEKPAGSLSSDQQNCLDDYSLSTANDVCFHFSQLVPLALLHGSPTLGYFELPQTRLAVFADQWEEECLQITETSVQSILHSLSLSQQLSLACIAAQGVLTCYSTRWLPPDWDWSQMTTRTSSEPVSSRHCLREESAATVCIFPQMPLDRTIGTSEVGRGVTVAEATHNLGVRLVELGIRRPIVEFRQINGEDPVITVRTAMRMIRMPIISDIYTNVIETCLTGEIGCGEGLELPRAQEAFFNRVLLPLETLVRNFESRDR